MFISFQKDAWNIIRNCSLFGLWLFGITLLLSYFIRLWSGDRFFLVRFVNYLMPWLLVVLIPGLAMAAINRHIGLGVTLTVPTLFICITYSSLLIPQTMTTQAHNMSLKIMSHNVWRGNRNLVETVEVIRRYHPEILLLQELDPKRIQPLITTLTDHYPDSGLHYIFDPQLSQAVISCYPLKKMEQKQKNGRAQKILIHTPQGPLTVFNVHFRRCGNWARRQHEISEFIQKEIISTNGPIIVGGDFNTTDQTQAYRLLNQHLQNAHWQAGKGFGFTYPSSNYKIKGRIPIPSPVVRIDHIFYSDHFSPLNAQTLNEAGGSDHLPITADFLWKDA